MNIDVVSLLWFALVGLVAGVIATRVITGSGYGLVGNLIVGVLGALLGGFIFSQLGFAWGGLIAQLIIATLGAMLLLFLLRFLKK